MILEETLNGGYAGLFGEITDKDVFHWRDVADIVSVNDPNFVHEKGHKRGFPFEPGIVFDIGANIGIASRYARRLFPHALIVAVEPDTANCDIFSQHWAGDMKMVLVQKAIGTGKIHRCVGAENGAKEVYLSEGPGYLKDYLEKIPTSQVRSLMLHELQWYIPAGAKSILKMDIEGSETVVFNDPASMEFLKKIDYFVIELHYYSQDQKTNDDVVEITKRALSEFSLTHKTILENNYFYALKRIL